MNIKAGDIVEQKSIYLEFISGRSNKFWMIRRTTDTSYTTRYGSIDSRGTTSVKKFDDPVLASVEFDKIVSSKLKKGYLEARPRSYYIRKDPNKWDKALVVSVKQIKRRSAYLVLTFSGESKHVGSSEITLHTKAEEVP